MNQKTKLVDNTIGIIGLGNMGRPMASRLIAAGWHLVGFDIAGTEQRLPEGGSVALSIAEVVSVAETVLLSLPNEVVVNAVTKEIVGSDNLHTAVVIDTSTIGIKAARRAATTLETLEILYIDAPVSGGVSGAMNGSLAMMVATDDTTFDYYRPMLEEIARNCFHVGKVIGQGQAMKLLNNFLSGTAMTATAEAVSFGIDQGLKMSTILEVLNASSGRNTATSDKFLRRVLTGTYDSGFTTNLISKDMQLYEKSVAEGGTKSVIGSTVSKLWQQAELALPGSDFTRIYEFVRNTLGNR